DPAPETARPRARDVRPRRARAREGSRYADGRRDAPRPPRDEPAHRERDGALRDRRELGAQRRALRLRRGRRPARPLLRARSARRGLSVEVPRGLVPALTAAFSKRRAALEALLAKEPGTPRGERLHDVRVVLRRTVALARLTKDVPLKESGAALRRAARDLRRALGARRTQEVAAGLPVARLRRGPPGRAPARPRPRPVGEGARRGRPPPRPPPPL